MILSRVSEFMDKLRGKVVAYNRVFDRQSVHTKPVLEDLARFCRAHTSTFHPDARVHAVLEGRREVWLRIQNYLQFTEEEIYQLHKVREYKEEKDVRGL